MSVETIKKARQAERKARALKERLMYESTDAVEDIAVAADMSVRGVYALLARLAEQR